MRRSERERLLSRAFEGLLDQDERTRVIELLNTDLDFRKAYEEALACHRALLDSGSEPMPEQLREEIRRAVEREPRVAARPVARSFPGRFGAWIAAPGRPRWSWVPAAVLVVGILAVAVWQLVPEGASARPSIAVVGFRNQTGDAAFDYLQETISNLLITSLEQSGCLEVTTMQRFKDLIRQAGEDSGSAVLDVGTALEICRREGITAVAVGFYTRAGNTFVTEVKVLETASGQPLETARAQGEGPASIIQTQVDEMSRGVTQGVGCPSPPPAGPAPRVIDATTGSLDAYHSYLRGRDELERNLFADARQSLEKAVAIDSTFAVAHLYLSDVYANLREYDAQATALREAMRYASRATERERLYIEASYAYVIECDEEARYRLLRDLVEKYPAEKQAYVELGSYYGARDLTAEALVAYQKAIALDPEFGPAINQMAFVYVGLGEFEQAMACLERYASIQPDDPNPIDSIAELYLRMGRLDESAAMYRQVLAAHPDFTGSWLALAYVSALQEDYPEAFRCVEEFTARAPSAGKVCEGRWVEAYYDYLLGRCDRAVDEYRSLRSEMVDIPYWPGVTNWILGYLYADRGEYDLALEAFDAWASWLEGADPSDVVFNLYARAMTRCHVELMRGQLDRARGTLTEMERLLPGLRGLDREDLQYKTSLWQAYSADLALTSDSVDVAVSIAERMVPRIPSMHTLSISMANTPPLGDVLARAYWRKGDLDRAGAEYARLTRQASAAPGRLSLCLIQPLYHYRYGRVLEEKGDGSRARTEYERFLKLWQDADPRHPELADARKRLAELSVAS